MGYENKILNPKTDLRFFFFFFFVAKSKTDSKVCTIGEDTSDQNLSPYFLDS